MENIFWKASDIYIPKNIEIRSYACTCTPPPFRFEYFAIKDS